jgi:uncharacterized protein YlxW (UPF0749 family)
VFVTTLRYKNSKLRETILIKKKKRKKGVRLNLCSNKSTRFKIYSPIKVTTTVAYNNEKEEREEKEEVEKEVRKIQRATNALKNKQEKAKRVVEREEKAATTQLAKEIRAANLTVPKTLFK